MKKLIAAVVASAFAFGAASTFAAPMAREDARIHREVRHTTLKAKQPGFHKVVYKKAHRHHMKRHHRYHRH